MNICKKFLSTIFFTMVIFVSFNYSYAYKNDAFEVDVPNKYMGENVISNSRCYGLGEGGNFLFLTEEDSSNNKIKKVKQDALEFINSSIKLYGNNKLFYNLRKTEINGKIAFIYESDIDEVYYYIPTDKYIIFIQVLSLDGSHAYNTEFMKVINSIKIKDTTNTISYNKNSLIIINWGFLLKVILIIFILIVIIAIIFIFVIKRKKIKKC